MNIARIRAYEILASGGFPTVQVEVELENGVVGVASVPYGVSAGSREATVLQDGDLRRYQGKGMLKAVDNISSILTPSLIGMNALDQRAIDNTMIGIDGTENKSKLGGNSILAVSVAVARAAALTQGKELYEHIAEHFVTNPDYSKLPQPMMVVIEGGKHADDTTDLQEYCMSAIGSNSPTNSIRKVLESYHFLKKVLKKEGLSVNVGNEGAFAPNGIRSNEAPFEFMMKAIELAGYVPGKDIGFSLDAAASEFYEDGKYNLALENKRFTSAELIAYFSLWLKKYPIVTVEDMLDENDWDNWVIFNKICRENSVPNIGDDITVTNIRYLQKAIDMDAISAILIKLNQIGSVTETVDTCILARNHGMMTVPSHRGGGETNDTAMVDLAVAVNGSYIKVGPSRGERVSKYNRLMEIERKLRG